MADKKINIKLKSGFDPTGVNAASRSIGKLSDDLNKSNKWLMQINTELADAIRRRASEVTVDLGAHADKTVKTAILSAKQIQAAWEKALCASTVNPPIDNAGKKFGELKSIALGALSGIGGGISKLGRMFFSAGIWGVAAAGIVKAFTFAWRKVREEAEQAAKRSERAFTESIDEIKRSADALDKAFSAANAGIDNTISRIDEMTNSVKELTKAEIELAKQNAIAGGMDEKTASALADDLKARVDYNTEEDRLRNLIAMEQKRIDAAKDAEQKSAEEVKKATEVKAAAEEDLAKKREDYIRRNAKTQIVSTFGVAGQMQVVNLSETEIAAEKARATAEFDASDEAAKLRENVRKAQDAIDSITTDEKAIAAAEEAAAKIERAEIALTRIETERLAREKEIGNQVAAEVRKEAETRKKAELDVAKAIAAEREKLEAELHRRRMADIKAEMDAQKAAASALSDTATAAQSEFDRAFALYRDPEKAAAQIAEEKDYAADLRQLHKDASRYGGKWRIDELSALMAAGDTQGIQSRLEDWRRSKSFTPQVEAMVRASAAEQTKTTAEDELRKLNDKTAELSQKMDTLAATRNNKLDGIEKNTNQLATKIDELLTVKG